MTIGTNETLLLFVEADEGVLTILEFPTRTRIDAGTCSQNVEKSRRNVHLLNYINHKINLTFATLDFDVKNRSLSDQT